MTIHIESAVEESELRSEEQVNAYRCACSMAVNIACGYSVGCTAARLRRMSVLRKATKHQKMVGGYNADLVQICYTFS